MYHGGGHVWRRYCGGFHPFPLLEKSRKPKCASADETDVTMAAHHGKMLWQLCVFSAM